MEVAVTGPLTGIKSLFAMWVLRISDLAANPFTRWNCLAGLQVLFFIYLGLLRDWRKEPLTYTLPSGSLC